LQETIQVEKKII